MTDSSPLLPRISPPEFGAAGTANRCRLPRTRECGVAGGVRSCSRFLATATDGSFARVWETAGGRLLNSIPPPATPNLGGPYVCDAAFTPDGQCLLLCGGDGIVRSWPWAGGATNADVLIKHQAAVIRFCLSPDGTRMATGSLDRTAVLADFPSGRPLCPPLQHDAEVIRVVFSPDGRLLATATYGGSAHLWDAFTGRELTPPMRHGSAVMVVAFSPDGQRLATASWTQLRGSGKSRPGCRWAICCRTRAA